MTATITPFPNMGLRHTRPLPPQWDGKPVTWDNWEHLNAVRICRDGTTKTNASATCGACGFNDETEWTCHGYTKPDAPLAPPRLRFTVWRCANCGQDTVYDHETTEVWDLDEDDYGPDGTSYPTEPDSTPPPTGMRSTR